jgi:hypothetical protein
VLKLAVYVLNHDVSNRLLQEIGPVKVINEALNWGHFEEHLSLCGPDLAPRNFYLWGKLEAGG